MSHRNPLKCSTQHKCAGGRITDGALGCNVCRRPARPDAALRDQVDRMGIRGIHDAWRVHIEKCARELTGWTWWMGPVSYVVGVEFAMAVAIGISYYAGRQWLYVCVREALEHLIPRVPMTTSTVDRAALFNLFIHVKETLLCLRASNGEILSNKAFGQARMKLAKEIKAHIEYKSGEETFNVANLNSRVRSPA